MSDIEAGNTAPPDVEQAPPAAAEPRVDKNEQAAKVISEILRLMDLPGRLELKDSADGGISVALFLEGQVPGVQAGRRSHLIDALQFIANKIVNRPQTERRWISIGVGAHPEPRPPPGGPRVPPQAQPRAPAPAQAAPMPPRPSAPPVAAAMPLPRDPAPRPSARPPRPNNGQPQPSGPRMAAPVRAAPPALDEATLDVAEDAALAKAARALMEKSAKLGRYFAIAPMKQEDRARILKATRDVTGAAVKVEGEGRNRRIVFVPDNPTPMPKRAIVDYGDDEDEADA